MRAGNTEFFIGFLQVVGSVGAALRRGWQIEDGRVVLPINHVMSHEVSRHQGNGQPNREQLV
jgi:hypothetical protein